MEGKGFRLRDNGIQNKNLASVKFILENEPRNKRNMEPISCPLVALTESFFGYYASRKFFLT